MFILRSAKPWLAGYFFASTLTVSTLGLTAAIAVALPAFAQVAEDKSASKEAEKPKTIKELIKNTTKIPGFLHLYQNKKDGSLLWRIKPEQLNEDFLHFVQSENGLVALGTFKGDYKDSNVYRAVRHFDRVDIVKQNLAFYFDKKSPLSRSASANINTPVVASEKIIAEDKKTGDIVIKADSLFLTESLHQITPPKNPNEKPGERLAMGVLSKEKTKYAALFGYPENTDIVVEYSYENLTPVQRKQSLYTAGDFAITDERYFKFKLRHSIVKAPKNGFIPRPADPRIGYFTQYKHDMTTTRVAPYRDVINRWHLVKKDKTASVSEPLEPITWWIENTTPVQFRETIRDAVLEWNKAFEKAGFKNAMVVKVQPDDATWEAGDLRYNVLRWTSSPQPVFSGYGPSFADPRTGQILGADIMLEFSGLTRRLQNQRIYQPTSFLGNTEHGHHSEQSLYNLAQFGVNGLLSLGATEVKVDEFVKSFLYYLTLHEVGHTLGLNHNMKASQLWDAEQIHDSSLTTEKGLTASVMDYPSVNFAPLGKEQGQYYTTTPGLYDIWAIEYGYSQALADESAERKRLDTLLARSTEKALAFGNDADDMRAPGKAIDPLVNINDMSSDAVKYAHERLQLLQHMKGKLLSNFSEPGQSYQALTNGFITLHQEYGRNLEVISRYIGGVTVDRSFHNQPGVSAEPFTPIDAKQQKRAMALLSEFAFAPEIFKSSQSLLTHLQQQRRGFDFFDVTEDPKLHELVLGLQKKVLDQLLHPAVMNRISDSSLYGNEYSLQAMMADLTEAIFAADAKGSVTSHRQNLQVEYINRLAAIVQKGEGHQYMNQSLARYYMTRIKRMLKTRGNNTASLAHKEQIAYLIDKALEVKS